MALTVQPQRNHARARQMHEQRLTVELYCHVVTLFAAIAYDQHQRPAGFRHAILLTCSCGGRLSYVIIICLNHGLWPCDPKSFQRSMVYSGEVGA